MGGRMMSSECEHGRTWDWGDFGAEDDSSKPQLCSKCPGGVAGGLTNRATVDHIEPGQFWTRAGEPIGLDTFVQVDAVGESVDRPGVWISYRWLDGLRGCIETVSPDEFLRQYDLLYLGRREFHGREPA